MAPKLKEKDSVEAVEIAFKLFGRDRVIKWIFNGVMLVLMSYTTSRIKIILDMSEQVPVILQRIEKNTKAIDENTKAIREIFEVLKRNKLVGPDIRKKEISTAAYETPD